MKKIKYESYITIQYLLFQPNQSTSSEASIPVWIAAVSSVGGLLAFVGLSVCIYKLKSSSTVRTDPKAKPKKRIKSSTTQINPLDSSVVKSDGKLKNLDF